MFVGLKYKIDLFTYGPCDWPCGRLYAPYGKPCVPCGRLYAPYGLYGKPYGPCEKLCAFGNLQTGGP